MTAPLLVPGTYLFDGTMPPWQAVLNDDGVAQMADYVTALATGTSSAECEIATTYRNYCSACHGADGAGMPLLGAPARLALRWLHCGRARVDFTRARGRDAGVQ